MITLIAAIGRNREIGLNNQLLWNLPEDLRHFKNYTLGKTILMGANTCASIGRKLPGRRSVVVTSRHELTDLCDRVYSSLSRALEEEKQLGELVIIGGQQIYQSTIDLADKLVITKVDHQYVADAYFPIIDSRWHVVKSTPMTNSQNLPITIIEYSRNEK